MFHLELQHRELHMCRTSVPLRLVKEHGIQQYLNPKVRKMIENRQIWPKWPLFYILLGVQVAPLNPKP